jgi:uncharacterized protein YbaP (TraB family)
MLWEIADTPHKLLGSSHVLPEEIAFPSWVAESYEGIERFVFESGGQGIKKEIGVDLTRAHLKSSEISAAYQSARTLLASIGNDDPFDSLLPWRVTFHVVDRFLPILGVSPFFGVEYHLRLIAESNEIKIDFLEPSTRSSELIDLSCKEADGGLSFLKETVDGLRSGECRMEMLRLIKAWLASDLLDLNAIRDETLIKCPSVFYPVIAQRDREWCSVTKRMCSDKSPTLFVVGCLHTVGSDSFIKNLEANGLRLNFIA